MNITLGSIDRRSRHRRRFRGLCVTSGGKRTTVPGREFGATLRRMDRPPPDPAKLLSHWMEWERGDTTPGEVMKNLKHGGLRDVLEQLVDGPAADA